MLKETAINTKTGEINLPISIQSKDLPSKRHEIISVISAMVALTALLSLVSYEGVAKDGSLLTETNLVGPVGTWFAYSSFTLFGLCAFILDAVLWMISFGLFFGNSRLTWIKGVGGAASITVFSCVLFHIALGDTSVMGNHLPGGFTGELAGEFLKSILAPTGATIFSICGIIVSLILTINFSLRKCIFFCTASAYSGVKTAGTYAGKIQKAWWGAGKKLHDLEEDVYLGKDKNNPQKKQKKEPSKKKKLKEKTEPKIYSKKSSKKQKESGVEINTRPLEGNYQLPPLSLLNEIPNSTDSSDIDENHLKEAAKKLIKILSDFGIRGEIREIHPGPVVTMYEFKPESGTKLSKIEGLSNEIAMALEVMKVRVVAPIPGKNAVGFELPSQVRETVYLKEMLIDSGFQETKNKLPMALGKDINGNPNYVDLVKMPHLLIAGTTGSGKSVALNAMLVSLLYKYTPEDLRLLLIDPKMIELGIYDKIPHLLLPVVTDMSKACLTLKWAVDEMERRYQLFADLGARNLYSYNLKVKDHMEKKNDKSADENNVTTLLEEKEKSEFASKYEKLPFIVIVIDELADLMMVSAKDVETSIARLAQKARAAGIHLIIATQRPSVDVITGLIKANFPSRISFRVSSGIDSRTILGTYGAENLLGKGDMLVLPPGTSDLTRVHGAFIDEDETANIVDFLKLQGAPVYDKEILKPREDEQSSINEDEKDEMYDRAVEIVAQAQACSISMLQRRLRIGYNRSARIVEIMEKEQVVGPANGVSKREVLISPQ